MQFIKKILHSTGFQQSALLTGGNFVATILTAVGLILISRHLGPSLFGEFTVGYSLMIILLRVQGVGLNVAIQKIAGSYFQDANWSRKLNPLLQVGTGINALLGVLFLGLGVVLAQPLAEALHISSPAIIFGSFLFATVTLFFEYVMIILQIIHKFAQSVMMMIIQSSIKFLVGVGSLWVATLNVEAIFYVFYFAPFLAMLAGLYMLPRAVKLFPITRDPEIEAKLLKVMKHTAILMATAGLVDYIDVLLVKRYTTPFETGIYGGISQIASAVMVVGYSLASVLNARVARYHNKTHIDVYIRKAIVMAVIAVVGFFVYLPLAKLSIVITIGPEYIAGLEYLQILMIGSFLLIATVPFIALFYSFDSPAYFSVSGLGQLAIVLVGGNFLIAEYGLTGAVWVRVASRVFLLALTLLWAVSAYRKKIHQPSFTSK